MIHLFKSALARAFTYALVTLLVAGLLLGALRLVLPYADSLRGAVAAQVGAATGLDARLGPMAVRLRGWSPELQFRDVRLIDPADGHTQIAMERLSIDLDLAASLRNLAPEIRALTLIGPRLLVRRLADGRLLVGGIGVGDGEGELAALDVFLTQGRLRIEGGELTWIDETLRAPPLTLTGVNARFVNAQGRHRLALQAQGIASGRIGAQTRQPGELRLVADLSGEPETPGLWGGEVYLSFAGADLAPLVRHPLPDGLQLRSGSVRLEAWTHLADGAPVEAVVRLDTRDLALARAPPGLPPERITLASLGATLHWRPFGPGEPDAVGGPGGWRLDLSDLTLIQGGTAWPTTDLGLVWSGLGGGAWALRGGLRSARLGPVMSLVRAAAPTLGRLLPLEGLDALDRLLEANPDGGLQGLTWRLTGGPDQPPTWALGGQVTGLSVQPAGAIPGVSGLDLTLSADQGGGQIALSGEAPTLSLPQILRAPLTLTRMDGEVRWWSETDGRLQIEVPQLAIDHAAVRTSTSLGLCLPPGGGSPMLDLQTHFGDGDAAKAGPLIPTGILKPHLVEWLDRSIISGQVPSGAVVFRGRLEDFPFPGHEGRLEVLFDVRDGVLDYLPGWPRLSGASGQILFLDRQMEISLTGGQILDSQVTGGSAFIDDLFVTRTLKIQASAAGPLADGLRVLREAPLSKGLGRLANVFAVSGGMRLDLDMVVPLHEGLELELDGLVSWPPGARIGLKGTPVELRDPQGQLRFDPHGVSADGIEAQLWGGPLRLDIGTQGDTPEDHLTLIRARATTPVATLAERLPSPLWSQLQGTPTWDLAVRLRSADMEREALPIDFELESDLKRVAVRLPAPLGKSAAGSRPLRLAGRFDPGETLRLNLDYADLKGRLAFAAKPGAALALTGGDIALGVELPTDPGPKTKPNGARREGEGTSEGIWFSGVIPELDGDAWRLWWDREAPALGGNQTPVAGRERPRDEAGLLRGGGLRIGSLSLGGSPWDDLYLRFQRVEYAWEVAIEGPQITGTLKVPDQPREVPVTVNLSHFDLEALAGDRDPASGVEIPEPDLARADPRRAPAVRLDIEHLRWGKADLGRLALEARAQSAGLDITTLSLRGDLATATGSGSWTQGPLGPDVRLKIKGDLVEPGALLRSAGYASVLDQAPAKVDLDLAWPGGPGDIALPLLIGQVNFDVGAGRLLDLDPGVGRILGILNIAALGRRLTLDFSDLFAKGYGFESMVGDVALARGAARINRFEIRGPAADVAITGEADLKTRRFDQVATVTPKISTGVAVASAVAGGPLVGAAVYLVDRVTGGAIDRIGSRQYRITGAWDAPDIEPIGVLGATPGQAAASRPDGLGEEPRPLAGAGAPAEPTGRPDAVPPVQPSSKAEAANPFLH